MRRAAFLETMFQKYGNTVTVFPKHKKEYQVKGLIRPMSFKNLPVSNEVGIPFDNTEDGGFLYLGSCKYRIDQELQGTKLEQDGEWYLVTKSQVVCMQNEPIYVCAVLQKVVE